MLQFDKVSVKKGKKQILSSVSFSLKPHTITALIGKNGSGKSTLLSCLEDTRAYTGKILFGDSDLALMPPKERAKLISFLPQSLPAVPITVEALVTMGRSPYLDIGKRLTEKDKEQIEKVISDMGIDHLRQKKLTEISGGERQKAYIAMVLAQNTRVVLLDEPTTYMDMQYEKEFFSLLEQLKGRHKKTLLVVMHDLSAAVSLADRVALLDEGELIFCLEKGAAEESGRIEEIFGVKKYSYQTENGREILYK